MTGVSNNDSLIDYLCGSLMDVRARLKVNEIVTSSLLNAVCEHSPQLIECIKQKISDVAELAVSMGELDTEHEAKIFQKEIQQCILRFSLIEESVRLNIKLSESSVNE